MTPICNIILFILIILSISFTIVGGYLDFTNQSNFYNISKEHFWNDGLFLLGIAIIFIHFCEIK